MYAIIECGGKQYRVQEGDRLRVEKMKAEAGSKVMLDQVLLLGGEKTVIGTPVVEGAAVSCTVLGHDKEKKILVYHYKAKKNIRKRYGHRQPFTSLLVDSILQSGYVKPKVEATAKHEVTKVTATETKPATEVVEPVKAKAPAKASAKKAATETAATAEEKPARKPRAKKTETPEA